MSKRDDDLPSADVLGELRGLVSKRDKKARARRAWEIVTGAYGNSDFAVVLDFALENELVLPCDTDRSDKKAGPQGQISTWVNPLDGSEMVWIPPGPFYVGEERRPAECRGFSLARYPVTNAQFKRFLDAGYKPAPLPEGKESFLTHWQKGAPPKGKEDHPVVWVSFLDAVHYCQWAGLMLPTEWLWEKAARGPDGRPFPWGTEAPSRRKHEVANVHSRATCPVGKYERSRTPYGCEDLVGNVSEWCQTTPEGDFGHMPVKHPQTEVPEPLTYAEVRGACFLRTQAKRMTSWHRRKLSVTRRNQWVGFRTALLLPCRPAL
jgi:serine/threonine-protein kinase